MYKLPSKNNNNKESFTSGHTQDGKYKLPSKYMYYILSTISISISISTVVPYVSQWWHCQFNFILTLINFSNKNILKLIKF